MITREIPPCGDLKERDRFTMDGRYVPRFFLWRWLWPERERLQVFVAGKAHSFVAEYKPELEIEPPVVICDKVEP